MNLKLLSIALFIVGLFFFTSANIGLLGEETIAIKKTTMTMPSWDKSLKYFYKLYDGECFYYKRGNVVIAENELQDWRWVAKVKGLNESTIERVSNKFKEIAIQQYRHSLIAASGMNIRNKTTKICVKVFDLITENPASATVYIDGKEYNINRAKTIAITPEEKHTIQVKKEGYYDSEIKEFIVYRYTVYIICYLVPSESPEQPEQPPGQPEQPEQPSQPSLPKIDTSLLGLALMISSIPVAMIEKKKK